MRDQPPLITLPSELDDEAAANLVDILRGLTSVLERYYVEQIARHYQRRNDALLESWNEMLHSDEDPPPT